MTKIDWYMNDGADWQAQAVLACLRYHKDILLDNYYGNKEVYEKLDFRVGRCENFREQGYVFTVYLGAGKAVSYAFYQHRNSDSIVVFEKVCGDAYGNTPQPETILGERDKNEYNVSFKYGDVLNCTKWILNNAKNYIDMFAGIESDYSQNLFKINA